MKLEEKESELSSEKKNALKRDKTIQGLTQVLREKEKEVSIHTIVNSVFYIGMTFSFCCTKLLSLPAQIAELFHEIEDRDEALAKARETAHKAQLQKYQARPALKLQFLKKEKGSTLYAFFPLFFQGVEEHQHLLMEKQTELAKLQGEHNAKVFEAQKLQRALDRREQELADLQQAKDHLEMEMEDLQQQKKKGDKALNV